MAEELSKQQLHILINAVNNYIKKKGLKKSRIKEKFPLLVAVAEVVLKDVIDAINNHTCPYCKARVKTRHGIIRHILIFHSDTYYSDLRQVVDIYVKLRKMLVKASKSVRGVSTQVFRLVVGNRVIVGKQSELAREIVKNPNILKELGVL